MVTAAAIVMVGVFGIFATLQFIDMKQFGVGLAAAVLIDATLVRGVLLPATMKLLGDWNWYLPKWLEWLPKGPALEGSPEPPEARAAQPGAARPAAGRGVATPTTLDRADATGARWRSSGWHRSEPALRGGHRRAASL